MSRGLLAVTEDDFGIWVQLEGDTVAEWEALDRLASLGEGTCGLGLDEIARLRETRL